MDAARAKLNAMPLPNPIANIRNVYATRPTVIRNGEETKRRGVDVTVDINATCIIVDET